MRQKPIELILLRHLADRLALPVILVDNAGNLVFFNPAAEALLGIADDWTEEAPFEEIAPHYCPTDAEGRPVSPEQMPVVVALRERRPQQARLWVTGPRRRAPPCGYHSLPARRPGRRFPGGDVDLLGDGARGGFRVKLTLWGTRGSLPCPRPGTVRYGGNTSCVQVETADGSMIVLDAGTGIHRLGGLGSKPSRVDVLLTHLHMVLGLGFFEALFRPDLEVHIWGPPSTTSDLHGRLSRYLSPPLFPVRLRDLPCRLVLHDAPRGTFEVPGAAVTADLVCHPGPTLGYRITADGASVAYIPDHEPALGADVFPDEPGWTSGFAIRRC